MEQPVDFVEMDKEVSDHSFRVLEEVFSDLINTSKREGGSEFKELLPFVGYMLERLEAISILLQFEKLWDAEIIFRSLLEAFAKFLNVSLQDEKHKFDEKLNEFWTHLSDIDKVTQSNKLKEFIKSENIINKNMFDDFILTDEEEAELKSKPSWGNRTYRKALRDGWSFSGIMMRLIDKKGFTKLVSIEMLLFYYKEASHVAHADKNGFNMMENASSHTGDFAFLTTLTHKMKLFKMMNEIGMWVNLELLVFFDDETTALAVMKKYRDYADFMGTRYVLASAQLVRERDKLLNNLYKK